MTFTIGANVYTTVGATPDTTNVSTTWGGISGVVTLSGSVSVSDGTSGNTVLSATASSIMRPSGRGNVSQLTGGDTLTMSCLLDAVARLRVNAGAGDRRRLQLPFGSCVRSSVVLRPRLQDVCFRALRRRIRCSERNDNDFLGLRFMPTTEIFVQPHPTLPNVMIRRPIICGAGALIEGDFAGMAADDVAPSDSIVTMVDGVAMVTREPIDRLQQIIAQSWYWMGGFCAPSDTTTNPTTVPTATNGSYKRAVIVEHAG